jgi:hypothetical protein
MRMRLFTVVGALAASALAAGAVPALSADRGTIAISITAQAPPAPCLTVTPGSVDFGTLPFSTIALDSFGRTNITVDNCGSAGQNLLAATTDATGPSGSWTPIAFSGAPDPCQTLNRNGFYLELFTPDPFRSLFMTGTPAPVRQATSGMPEVFPAGEQVFRLSILMPCVGSNGAGETKTLTATFTAVVP